MGRLATISTQNHDRKYMLDIFLRFMTCMPSSSSYPVTKLRKMSTQKYTSMRKSAANHPPLASMVNPIRMGTTMLTKSSTGHCTKSHTLRHGALGYSVLSSPPNSTVLSWFLVFSAKNLVVPSFDIFFMICSRRAAVLMSFWDPGVDGTSDIMKTKPVELCSPTTDYPEPTNRATQSQPTGDRCHTR